MAGFARILLCAEGAHDMGRERPMALEGWLQPLIRRFADNDADLHFSRWPRSVAAGIRGSRLPAGVERHGKVAYRAMEKAVREEFDIVVYMVDNDTPDQRDRHRWREICEEIWSGFEAVKDAVCGVACIPISASESWLLADHAAWEALGLTDCSRLPGNGAEFIWGQKNDLEGNRPHRLFDRMFRDLGRKAGPESGIALRSELGETLSLETLKTNCPASFIPFARSMEACLAKRGCLTGFDFASLPANEAPCQ